MKTEHKNYCSRCKVEDEYMTPCTKRKRRDGSFTQYYYCYPCANTKRKRWYQANKETARAISARSIQKHYYKQQARMAVRIEVRAGRLVKPDSCSRCQTFEEKLQAHHHDYDKPLDITWLCKLCHTKEDKTW